MDEAIPAKKTARTRKTVTEPVLENAASAPKASPASTSSPADTFTLLINQLNQHQVEFENLQKEITTIKELWLKEQKNHEAEINTRNQQKEQERKREEETYLYERSREHKKTEDEFLDRKIAWEKHLREQKEAIEKDKQELEALRKSVAGFETDKVQVVKEAVNSSEQQMTNKFEAEKRLKEQEVKAEKEILNLKITGLTAESVRQAAEIESLKKALDEATKQVKEIAVKVIESRSNTAKPLSSEV